jgi:hypothetical protein
VAPPEAAAGKEAAATAMRDGRAWTIGSSWSGVGVKRATVLLITFS